ncbi:MAG: hypothetical protein NTU44_05230 [Bacteroidetes bacterium]|nr:hypothetical protein [Bacteroidota bacterium]
MSTKVSVTVVLILTLFIGIQAFTQSSRQVPLSVLTALADNHAISFWGDARPADPIPYYSPDGQIVAWCFNYCIGNDFPDQELLTEEYNSKALSADKNARWRLGEYAHILMSGTYDYAPVIKFQDVISEEYAYGAKIREMAENYFHTTNPQLEKIYFFTPLINYYQYKYGNEVVYVRIFPPMETLTQEEFQVKMASTGTWEQSLPKASKSTWETYITNNNQEAAGATTLIPHEELVENLDWSYGCSPTAGAMALGYYDAYGFYSTYHYGNLEKHHYQHYDYCQQETDYNVTTTQYYCCLAMQTDSMTGGTWGDLIGPGVALAANGPGCGSYNFSQMSSTWDTLSLPNINKWTNIVTETDNGRIWMSGVQYHSMTGVGYYLNASDSFQIIHDTWHPGNAYWNYRTLVGITRIFPGGAYGTAIKLLTPYGDPRYSDDVNNPTPYLGGYHAGDVCEITWDYQSMTGDWVKLYYTTTGGFTTWIPITSNTENDGSYNWVIPAGLSFSNHCRVKVEAWTMTGMKASDGSWGNFNIYAGGSIPELYHNTLDTTETAPDFYKFQSGSVWGAVGVRAQDSSANWSMEMYPDLTFDAPIVTSGTSNKVDFVVVDGHHSPSIDRGIKAYRYSGTGQAEIEYDGGYETINSGYWLIQINLVPFVVQMFDVYLEPGTYFFTLSGMDTTSDLDFGLFKSSGSAYYASRSSIWVSSAHVGAGLDESFSVTVTSADWYGLAVWSNDQIVTNFYLGLLDKATWTGAVSTDWHDPANWLTNLVPDNETDVKIPDGTPFSPVINTANATCKTIQIYDNANLTIGPKILTVSEDVTVRGNLTLYPNADLMVLGNIVWYAGSTASASALSEIKVYNDWDFRNGANVQLTAGSVSFVGNGTSMIRSYEEGCSFNALICQKGSAAAHVEVSTLSTEDLRITDNLQVKANNTFISSSAKNIILEGNIVNTNGHFQCDRGTFVFDHHGGSDNHLNTGDYFNHLTINRSGGSVNFDDVYADTVLVKNDLMILHGTLKLDSCALMVGRHWENLVGDAGLDEGTQTVVFTGDSASMIKNDETFYNLVIDKTYAAYDGVQSASSTGLNINVLNDLDIKDGTFELNTGTRLSIGNTVNISGGAGLNANDAGQDSILIYVGDDWFDLNPTSSQTQGFDDGTYSRVIFNGTPSSGVQYIDERCHFNDLEINGTATYARPYDGTVQCKNLKITKGKYRLYNWKTVVDNKMDIYGTLQMDMASDSLVVGYQLTWQPGSYSTVTNGKIIAQKHWSFESGTHANLGTGNTVIFGGSALSIIQCNESNAVFGTLQINKTSGTTPDTYISLLSTDSMVVAGKMTLFPGNSFHCWSKTLVTQDTLFVNNTALMDVDSGFLNANSTLSLNGEMKVSGGIAYLPSAFDFETDGKLTLSDGLVRYTKPSTTLFIKGTLEMAGGVLDIPDDHLTISSTCQDLITGGTIKVGRSFYANTANTFQPSGGKVEFVGGPTSTYIIQCKNGNYFYDLAVNKTTSIALNNATIVKHDLSILSGTLKNTGNYDLNVGGDWANYVGTSGFTEGTCQVIFDGSGSGDILTNETFYKVVLNKTYASYDGLELGISTTVNITQDLEVTNGTLEMNKHSALNVKGDLSIALNAGLNMGGSDDEDLTLTVGGNWTNLNTATHTSTLSFHADEGSTVIFNGSSDQLLTLSYTSETFWNLIIDKASGKIKPNNQLVAEGNLDVMKGTWGYAVSGLTHKFGGNVTIHSTGVWGDATGITDFTGENDQQLNFAGTGNFKSIYVDKSPTSVLTLTSNLTSANAGLCAVNEGTFSLGGFIFNSDGNVSVNDGGLMLIPAGSSLLFPGSRSLTVSYGGWLKLPGVAGNLASIRAISPAILTFSINSGGTLSAEYADFRGMSSAGVQVKPGAIIDTDHSFNHCSFSHGQSGGTLLTVNNDQYLSVEHADFPTNTWNGASNVKKVEDQGYIEFINYTGGFAGEAYDDDNFNRIDWTINSFVVSGNLTYNNTSGTPLNNTTVTLYQGIQALQYTSTNGAGAFSFNEINPGSYQLKASCDKSWGGCNATDALLIMKHFVELAPLSGLKLKAADLDGSGYVNTIDALKDMQRFVGLIETFPVGDWVFDNPEINVIAGDLTQNFKGLCYGDVDGSYLPPFKMELPVYQKGDITVQPGLPFEVPVALSETGELGALSLVIRYPAENLELIDVKTIRDEENLVFHMENGELRLAWYGKQACEVNAGEAVIYLKMRLITPILESKINLSCGSESEISDFEGNTNRVGLILPRLTIAETENELWINPYPNPMTHYTYFQYSIPEDGKVWLKVYNVLGELVTELVPGVIQTKGSYSREWKGSNYPSGNYYYQLRVEDNSRLLLKTGKIVKME